MATSKIVQENLDSMTECSICTNSFSQPKTLPCMHTFCLKCLEQYAKNKQPGEEITCPFCRAAFVIPMGHFKCMPDNYFIKKLIELRGITTISKHEDEFGCENCSAGDGSSTETIGVQKASKYCNECQQKLCDQCVELHGKHRITQSHRIVTICADKLSEVEEMLKKRNMYCEQHSEERVNLYCRGCSKVICTVCYATKHKTHECEDIVEVSDEFRQQINNDLLKVSKTISNYQEKRKCLEMEKKKFLEEILATELSIQCQSDKLVELIRSNQNELSNELDTVKKSKLKAMEMLREEFDHTISLLNSTELFGKELIGKGSNFDMVCMASDLLSRTKELNSIAYKSTSNTFVKVTFQKSDMHNHLQRTENIVGEICIVTKKDPLAFYRVSPVLLKSFEGAKTATGITVLNKEFYIVRLGDRVIDVHNIDNFALNRKLTLKGSDIVKGFDIKASFANGCLYVSDNFNSKIYCIEPMQGDILKAWTVGNGIECISVTNSGNVLVTRALDFSIKEYTMQGIHVRNIDLTAAIQQIYETSDSKFHDKAKRKAFPHHCVQIDHNRFVVCIYSQSKTLPHKVCIVDNEGQLITSAGDQIAGSLNVQFYKPNHVYFDDSLCKILVADTINDRIVLLEPSMEFIQNIVTAGDGLRKPTRVCMDEESGHLFVVNETGTLTIYKVKSSD